MDWFNWRFYPYHLFGAFFFVTVLRRYVTRRAAIWITAIGAVGLEVYQWLFEPYYAGKVWDTALDLVADAIGIWIGVTI